MFDWLTFIIQYLRKNRYTMYFFDNIIYNTQNPNFIYIHKPRSYTTNRFDFKISKNNNNSKVDFVLLWLENKN